MRIGGQPTGDVLRLAEGFEEAVSVTQLSDGKFKVWGDGGIRRYGLIVIPERIRKIVIYSQHGQEAAQAIEDARDQLTANEIGRAHDLTTDTNEHLVCRHLTRKQKENPEAPTTNSTSQHNT